MENRFSDLEGLRIAMEIEQTGADFYQKAYDQTENSELKEIFVFLRQEEERHFTTFNQMYTKLKSNKEYTGDEYLFDADTSRYLTVLAEGHIFPLQAKIQSKLSNVKAVEDIFNLAIQAEKDSILFFDELASQAKFEETRKIFSLLKSEEQGHLIKLRYMLDKLGK